MTPNCATSILTQYALFFYTYTGYTYTTVREKFEEKMTGSREYRKCVRILQLDKEICKQNVKRNNDDAVIDSNLVGSDN